MDAVEIPEEIGAIFLFGDSKIYPNCDSRQKDPLDIMNDISNQDPNLNPNPIPSPYAPLVLDVPMIYTTQAIDPDSTRYSLDYDSIDHDPTYLTLAELQAAIELGLGLDNSNNNIDIYGIAKQYVGRSKEFVTQNILGFSVVASACDAVSQYPQGTVSNQYTGWTSVRRKMLTLQQLYDHRMARTTAVVGRFMDSPPIWIEMKEKAELHHSITHTPPEYLLVCIYEDNANGDWYSGRLQKSKAVDIIYINEIFTLYPGGNYQLIGTL